MSTQRNNNDLILGNLVRQSSDDPKVKRMTSDKLQNPCLQSLQATLPNKAHIPHPLLGLHSACCSVSCSQSCDRLSLARHFLPLLATPFFFRCLLCSSATILLFFRDQIVHLLTLFHRYILSSPPPPPLYFFSNVTVFHVCRHSKAPLQSQTFPNLNRSSPTRFSSILIADFLFWSLNLRAALLIF